MGNCLTTQAEPALHQASSPMSGPSNGLDNFWKIKITFSITLIITFKPS